MSPSFIFASGKLVVTGVQPEDDSCLASHKYARSSSAKTWFRRKVLRVQDTE